MQESPPRISCPCWRADGSQEEIVGDGSKRGGIWSWISIHSAFRPRPATHPCGHVSFSVSKQVDLPF